MRVFLAGATGVLGRRLVPQLLSAGHDVIGLARSEAGAHRVRDLGGEPAMADALHAEGLREAVTQANPEVVVNQLTRLPMRVNPRRAHRDLAATNRLRREATPTLVEAAEAAGAHRVISQSVAFAYRPEGPDLATEDEPLFRNPPRAFAGSVDALRALERATLDSPDVEGVVLRYGYFYGPGTAYAVDGPFARAVRRRRLPIVGRGEGVFSFLHVDDAAAATVAALEGPPGVYNVVDDDPTPYAVWLPRFAELLRAPPPRRVPRLLGRLGGGRYGVYLTTMQRGASNAEARAKLGWAPIWPSWREGFAADLAAP